MNRTGYSQRLELRQSQTLVMTPQLQQAIKMLQLSNLELTQFVDAEIQQNQLLERREVRLEAAAPAAPGEVAGVMQINAIIPAGVTGSTVPVSVQIGSASTQNGVTIAVH